MTNMAHVMPAFATALRKVSGAALMDYYTGPFDTYEQSLLDTYAVRADIDALLQAIRGGSRVLEIGAGAGRVTIPLATRAAHVLAIEPSATAFARLSDAVRDCDTITALQSRIEDVRRQDWPIDDVVLSSLSVNLFLQDDIDRLLGRIATLLEPGGRFVFGCFDGSSLACFESYGGLENPSFFLDVFEDDVGRQRLMYMLVAYDSKHRRLLQNWMIASPHRSDAPPIAVSTMVEQIWTIDQLAPHLESAGFRLSDAYPFAISVAALTHRQRRCMSHCVDRS